MAADDLSPSSMPPVEWTGNAGSSNSRDDEKKEKKLKQKKTDDTTSTEVDFEPIEHELDSTA